MWAHHVHVLLDPSYLADPRAEAKALLKAITDQLGAERRRREPKTPMLTMRPQVRPHRCCPAEYFVASKFVLYLSLSSNRYGTLLLACLRGCPYF